MLSRRHPPGHFPLVLVLDHLKPGFNVGKILRSANAFGCREVHLVGVRAFDPTPSKGSLRHTRTRSFDTFAESFTELSGEGYAFFALDPAGVRTLDGLIFPERAALVLGHEEYGLSFDPAAYPGVEIVSIPQYGLVQSLNVSIAAALATYEYVRQRRSSATPASPPPAAR